MDSDNQTPGQQSMPPALAFVLTHRLPCSALMLLMLMTAVWLPTVALNPVLLLLITSVGLAIHMLVPALVALITFGGGMVFAAQVTAITAVAVTLLAGFTLMPGLVVMLLYGLIPIFGALLMMRPGGNRLSAELMALALGVLTLLAMVIAAMAQNVGIEQLIGQMLGPLFEGVEQQLPGSQPEAAQMLEQARQMMVAILPGLMMMGLWFTWWGNVVLAKFVAGKYNFYRGDDAGLLDLRFGKPVAYMFLVLLVLLNLSAGDMQYLSANAAILVGGMLATQGIAVAHSWLKAKNMMFSISMMYLMLIIWSIMIIPFVMIGLMDIWFDYRRNIPAAGG